MKAVKLFNTLTRKVEELKTLNPNEVKIYCCGPTVYSYQHIGNFKTFINEDSLVRVLKYAGYKVTHVMNITDVGHNVGDGDDGEDKMLVASRKEKKSILDIAKFYTDKFFTDWDKLKLTRPDVVCKATDHIQEMLELIKRIQTAGLAYESNGNIYFDVQKFEKYGELAGLKLEDLKAGARIEIDQNKRHPADFVLWFTKSKYENHELLWDSPWGAGYPGWHIECSAMSMKYLGEQFDIHCGGIDHIPVHHTNEIAQTEAATGKPWVNYWFHCEHIHLNNEKISKSTGNYLILDDLEREGISAQAYKLVVYGTHYRKQMNFSLDALRAAEKNYQKLKNIVIDLKSQAVASQDLDLSLLAEFEDAIFSDLNLAQALATVWKVCSLEISAEQKLGLLLKMDEVLALDLANCQNIAEQIPEAVQHLVELRKSARQNRNWSESDRLRDEIKLNGYEVLDAGSDMTLKKI